MKLTKPIKIGKQTQLNDIQARYRHDMLKVYDLPREEQADRIRFLVKRLNQEKAAVGGGEAGDEE